VNVAVKTPVVAYACVAAALEVLVTEDPSPKFHTYDDPLDGHVAPSHVALKE